MTVTRTPEGVSANCNHCGVDFEQGKVFGTSEELKFAVLEADWNWIPNVCKKDVDELHVWRNEGQPSDKDPKNRAKLKKEIAAFRAAKPAERVYKKRRRVLL